VNDQSGSNCFKISIFRHKTQLLLNLWFLLCSRHNHSAMRCSISTVTACGLLLVANKAVAQDSYALLPYLDPQCTQPVEGATVSGHTANNMTFANTNGAHNFPYWTPIVNPEFPGAEAKVGSGYGVYWQIGELGPQCRVVLALQYSQSTYGSLGFSAPPGNTILAAKNAGCYYSSIPVSNTLDVIEKTQHICRTDRILRAKPHYSPRSAAEMTTADPG